jgi:ABC-type polysaccharide/polyol phosphate transport system ATPase subunit
MIKINNLSKIYEIPVNELNVIKKLFFFKKNMNLKSKNSFYSLRGINLNISKKEKVFIIGPSSSGKSTLFSILSKKIDYDKGEIFMTNNFFSATLIRIPPNLIPGLKIVDYVKTLISFILKNEIKNIDILLDEIFNLLNLNIEQRNKHFYEFDIFFFKNLILTIACFSKAKIFLFDNFKFNFNDQLFFKIFEQYLKNNQNSSHLFFGCQKINIIKKYSSKILIMDHGRIVKFDRKEKIDDKEILKYIGSKNENDEFMEDDDET